jgi:tetratricopeptide (TPR) repeat protein
MSDVSTAQGAKKEVKPTTMRPGFSGAAGGPATFKGTAYQTEYAIYRTLELITRALATPTMNLSIGMEPRSLHQGDSTEWDISIAEPRLNVVEAKLAPTRQDIIDWLDRVRQAGDAGSPAHFTLVYSEGRGPLLRRLDDLSRIAREATSTDHLDNLIGNDTDDPQVRIIMETLKESAFALLRRTSLELWPQKVLSKQVTTHVRLLSGESAGRQLSDLLHRKFTIAASSRLRFGINDIILEVRTAGILLQPPPERTAGDVSREAADALLVIQTCKTGVPIEVVADIVALSVADLERELTPFVTDGVLVKADLWTMSLVPSQLNPPDATGVLRTALACLLDYVEMDSRTSLARTQVHNILALAKHCRDSDPSLVSRVFRTVDGILKDWGDKHLVLEIANLSIEASRAVRGLRGRTILENEAHALVCGRSWVFQRIGRLTQALEDAERSLKLGQDIGWERNTAFCRKCIGRLLRMEAERKTGDERSMFLQKSVNLLEDAIVAFSSSPEFGPGHAEVGDCYSLLGRTHLVNGDIGAADAAVRKSYEILSPGDGKDYIDLRILNGDIEIHRGNYLVALNSLDDALSHIGGESAVLSELTARVHYGRGRALHLAGDRPAAVNAYRGAFAIYRDLNELERAAEALWQALCLEGRVPDSLMPLLQQHRFLVRTHCVVLHEERLTGRAVRVLARRSESPSEKYWHQLIEDARARAASEERDW